MRKTNKDRFKLYLDGKTYDGHNGTVELKIDEPGKYKITVKKIGYNYATAYIEIKSRNSWQLYAFIGGLIVLLLGFIVWSKFLKKKPKEEEEEFSFTQR